MGAVLRNAAFLAQYPRPPRFLLRRVRRCGGLCAQAAHIPVHLGSMAFAMAALVARMQWAEGDMVILNDPFLGGTHLPDVTVDRPAFYRRRAGRLPGESGPSRGHRRQLPGLHAPIPSIHEEGQVIEPVHLIRRGVSRRALLERIAGEHSQSGGCPRRFLRPDQSPTGRAWRGSGS